jgi:hypothetical protein
MHLETVIEEVWRCIWRPGSTNLEIDLEVVIKRV